MIIIFIGPRSIGKSTIGKALSKKLKVKYFDFDTYVEKELKGIDEHIEKKSVESYRVEEEKILKQFVVDIPKECILSVGGGTIASQFDEISKSNSKLLKATGKIIYLSPFENKEKAIKMLFEREQKRAGDKTYSETIKLFELRKPIYEEIFDLKIEVNDKSIAEIVEILLIKVAKLK
ncbi:hypothetical protein KY313_01990 [Candidatus Woesearchaeota archaeon]|nr:hypothetical protein [Candidatus Woesearchaeota archaeon]